MTDPTADEPTVSDLGDTLRSLSDAASDLGTDLTELNSAVDALQTSAERCGETQRSAAESLTGAARSLSTDGSPAADAGRAVPPTPADD